MHKRALAAVLAMPSLAAARPVTVGVALGLTESAADANAGSTSSDTLGIFGRLGLTSRVSGQLELQRIELPNNLDADIRAGTALLVVDLGSRGRLMPMIMAGIGFDSASTSFASTTGYHIEGGFGLEYRADGGLTIGGDLRMGGRSLGTNETPGLETYDTPITLRDGDYRSARLYAAVRF